jgi:ferritin-like metal-binding protein YciE
MPLPQKLNVQKALKAKLAGQSYSQIAKAQNVGTSTVHQQISPILKALPNAEELAQINTTIADHYAVTAYRSLAAITDEKLAKSTAKDCAIIAGIATQNNRLISGQSTSNTAVMLASAVIRAHAIEVDDGGE